MGSATFEKQTLHNGNSARPAVTRYGLKGPTYERAYALVFSYIIPVRIRRHPFPATRNPRRRFRRSIRSVAGFLDRSVVSNGALLPPPPSPSVRRAARMKCEERVVIVGGTKFEFAARGIYPIHYRDGKSFLRPRTAQLTLELVVP